MVSSVIVRIPCDNGHEALRIVQGTILSRTEEVIGGSIRPTQRNASFQSVNYVPDSVARYCA